MSSYIVKRNDGDNVRLLSNNLLPLSVLFLAEGNAEAHFIDDVLNRARLSRWDDVGIIMLGGVDNLPRYVNVLTKDPNVSSIRSVGVFVDAETQPLRRRNHVNDALRAFNVPAAPDEGFSYYGVNGQTKGGFFISPGNGSNGRIEDVVLTEIEHGNEFGCIREAIDCYRTAHAINLRSKEIVNMYLAAKSEHTGVGRAFRNGTLNSGDRAYDRMRQVILQLV